MTEPTTDAIPVLKASATRLNARLGTAALVAVGGAITSLPQIAPTLNEMFPHYVKQIGWACLLIGWLWNAIQRALDAKPGTTHDVNYTPPQTGQEVSP